MLYKDIEKPHLLPYKWSKLWFCNQITIVISLSRDILKSDWEVWKFSTYLLHSQSFLSLKFNIWQDKIKIEKFSHVHDIY